MGRKCGKHNKNSNWWYECMCNRPKCDPYPCQQESCCYKDYIFYALKTIKNAGIDVTVKYFNGIDTNSISGKIGYFDSDKQVVQIGNKYVFLSSIAYIELKENFPEDERPKDCLRNDCCSTMGFAGIIGLLGLNLEVRLLSSLEAKVITIYSVCNYILWGQIDGVDVAIPLCSISSIYTTTTTTVSPLGSIEGVVWVDLDENGKQENGEIGVPNVKVELYDDCESESPLETVTTDEDGKYIIQNLKEGNYYVRFSEIPQGYKFIQSNEVVDENGKTECFILGLGENKEVNSPILLNLTTTTTTTRPGTTAVPLGSIGQLVWVDANENGVQDKEEVGMPNVTVKLYNSQNGALLETVVTDKDGKYKFSDMEEGEYYIKFSGIPAEYKFINSNNILLKVENEEGITRNFDLGAGENRLDLNCPCKLKTTD